MIIGLQCSSKQKAAGLPNNLAVCFLFVAHVPVRRVEHFSGLCNSLILMFAPFHSPGKNTVK